MSITYNTVQRFDSSNGCTAGGTINLRNGDGNIYVILAPNADISGLTINWMSAPQNGQVVTVVSTKNITNIVHTGGSINRSFPSIKVGGSANFIYDNAGTTFMSNGVDLSLQSVIMSYTGSSISGNAVIYATDDGTPTGNALFSSIDYVHSDLQDTNPNIGKGKPVISNANKTITIPVVKQIFNGVTVATVNVIGSNTISAAPDATLLSVLVQGKLAIQ